MGDGAAEGEAVPAVQEAGGRLAALTGWPGGPPLPPPPQVLTALDALVADIGRWSATVGMPLSVAWEPLLVERAALLGLGRRGRVSANGSCHLLRAADGWVALNLPRADDVAGVDALVGGSAGDDPWGAVAGAARDAPVADLVGRARLLGLPAAELGTPGAGARPAVVAERRWASAGSPRRLADLRVLDLSAMWAGPLAAMLLAAAGATVVKVESVSRPDGARARPAFYRRLHPPGQPEVRLDFADPDGRRRLRELVDRADVVIEASRPRALAQLGVGPPDVVDLPGRVWVSITGHGRRRPAGEWVAFGDDAAVAGGLVGRDGDGGPVFLGDAVADPVAGLHAAAATLRALAHGGGVLLDVAMSHAAASLVAGPAAGGAGARRRDGSVRSGGHGAAGAAGRGRRALT